MSAHYFKQMPRSFFCVCKNSTGTQESQLSVLPLCLLLIVVVGWLWLAQPSRRGCSGPFLAGIHPWLLVLLLWLLLLPMITERCLPTPLHNNSNNNNTIN